MAYSSKKSGFSLLEMIVVIAVIAFFALIALPNFMHIMAKAKRSEAYIHLRALYMLEKAYFAEHGSYTDKLQGPDSLSWKPEGQLYYTYGFANGNSVPGLLKASASDLTGTSASKEGFTIGAAGDIDNDGTVDLLTIDQSGNIKVVKDDLA